MTGLPESRSQAETWDRTRNRYAAVGLCDRCAAQAAWGHQLGFTEVHAPCEGCAEVVATLPVGQVNGWHWFRRGRSAPGITLSAAA